MAPTPIKEISPLESWNELESTPKALRSARKKAPKAEQKRHTQSDLQRQWLISGIRSKKANNMWAPVQLHKD